MSEIQLQPEHSVVTLLSGGLDAACLVGWAAQKGLNQRAIYFNYGHDGFEREYACARASALQFDVPIEMVDLSGFRASMIGRYGTPLNMGANLLGGLLTSFSLTVLCGSLGILDGRDTMIMGIHGTDLKNRPQIGRMRTYGQEVMSYCLSQFSDRKFRLLFPFETFDRIDVIRMGQDAGVDFAKTWSCQSSFQRPCGKCFSCQERASAFAELGIPDPLL